MEKTCLKNNLEFTAVVCEYNPFHLGHLHQLQRLARSYPDRSLLCLMSGNFVQRGEPAVLDKYTRAKEAIAGGADAVIGLPVPFAAANAERFCLGAVKLLSSIPAVKTLAFGTEYGTAEEFSALADLLVNESDEWKAALKKRLEKGASFAAARADAIEEVYPSFDGRLYRLPNAALALGYAAAAKRLNAAFDLLPLPREGAGHDRGAADGVASASFIRQGIYRGETESVLPYLPEKTRADLPLCLSPSSREKWDAMAYYALIDGGREKLSRAPDCSEGLENALFGAAKEVFSAEEIVRAVTSARYPAARLRRILSCNALSVTEENVKKFASSPLYLSALAVNKAVAPAVFSALSESGLPLLTRKGDEEKLPPLARECFACEERADKIYSALCGRKINPYATVFAERA